MTIYAAQYRDMNTAVHGLQLVRSRRDAEQSARDMHRRETISPDSRHIAQIERINYRNPPEEHEGQRVVIVNSQRNGPTHLTPADVF